MKYNPKFFIKDPASIKYSVNGRLCRIQPCILRHLHDHQNPSGKEYKYFMDEIPATVRLDAEDAECFVDSFDKKCNCYYCDDKVTGHGEYPCEYYDHHCDSCHEKGLCKDKACTQHGDEK